MFAGLGRAWRAFWLTPLPDRPKELCDYIHDIRPTETPFMRQARYDHERTANEPPHHYHERWCTPQAELGCEGRNCGTCPLDRTAPPPPPWMNRYRCDCGYTGGQCVGEPTCRRNLQAEQGNIDPDPVPTSLPPPPPDRQQPGDEVLDAYEVAAREVEHDLKTLHAAMVIALDEGKGLAAEIRFRGEMERMHIRKQLELAKSLVLNFRDRRHQLNTNEAVTTATEAVAMAS